MPDALPRRAFAVPRCKLVEVIEGSIISLIILVPTLSNLDRKEMKSAHSLTLSKDCRHLSTSAANFLYLASLANRDVAAGVSGV